MPCLDANLLLRWLLDDVPKQSAAVDRLLNSGESCRLPDVALIEVAFVLDRTMRFSRELVADYLDAVLALGSVQIDRRVWRAAVGDYRTHPKLSIADCYLAAVATVTGDGPLYTFDAKLAKQLPGAELLR